MGRTAFLARVLGCADPRTDDVIALRPAGNAPLAALRAGYPRPLPGKGAARALAAALTRNASGRRLVLAADDAHLMDDATLSVLQQLAVGGGALLLVSRPLAADRPSRPDPTAWLAHLRSTQTVTLLPLTVAETAAEIAGRTEIAERTEITGCDGGGQLTRTAVEAVHAAARGNPSSLRALLDVLFASPPCQATAPGREDIRFAVRQNLVVAAWEAWRECTVDRADELCRLALRCGEAEAVAPIWGMLLLLRGHPGECLDFLGPHGGGRQVPPRLAIVRALAQTLDDGQPDEAGVLLLSLSGGSEAAEFLLAFRAWLLANAGRDLAVRNALADLDRTDHATALFIHATRAVLAELSGEHHKSVFHLRRAIASAETSSDDFPWIRPYLQGALIDALMSCGRVKEAVSSAQRFHAHEPSSGWQVAVSMHTLIAKHCLGHAGAVGDELRM
jgi:hypothetical protein